MPEPAAADAFLVESWHKHSAAGLVGRATAGRLETAQLLAQLLVGSGAATHCFILRRVDRTWYGAIGIVDGEGWRPLSGSRYMVDMKSGIGPRGETDSDIL